MDYTLRNTVILGLVTNKAFLFRCLNHPEFISGKNVTTQFVDTYLASRPASPLPIELCTNGTSRCIDAMKDKVGVVAMAWFWYLRKLERTSSKSPLWRIPPGYRNVSYSYQFSTFILADEKGNKHSIIQTSYETISKRQHGRSLGKKDKEAEFHVIVQKDAYHEDKCERHAVKKHVPLPEDATQYCNVFLEWCRIEEGAPGMFVLEGLQS
jgi:acetyl/propionyl-CoA carboxylase alpha subunit